MSLLLRGKTIFMLEDDVLNSAIIRTILRENGARAPYEFWGDSTLKKMTEYPFPLDMILLDLMLPGETQGHDVFTAIKQHDQLKSIPVVAVSAADPDVEIPHTKAMGFSGFICKPVNRFEFPKQLLSIFEGRAIWGR